MKSKYRIYIANEELALATGNINIKEYLSRVLVHIKRMIPRYEEDRQLTDILDTMEVIVGYEELTIEHLNKVWTRFTKWDQQKIEVPGSKQKQVRCSIETH